MKSSILILFRISLFIIIDLILILFFIPLGYIDLFFFNKNRLSDCKNIIILIHGTGASEWQWSIARLYLRLFNKQYISVEYNSRQCVEKSCKDVINQIPKISNISIIGHSQGGLIALYLHQYFDIKSTFLLHTPQKGAKIIDWLYHGEILSDQLKDMQYQSYFIQLIGNIKVKGNIYEIMGNNDYVREGECVVFKQNVYKSFFGHYFSAVNPYLWITYIIPNINC